MSGLIALSDDASWFRANWLCHAVFSAILESTPPGLVRDALGQAIDSHLLYLDPTSWSSDDVDTLLVAAEQAYRGCEINGPSGWHDPGFYPTFLASFRDLLHGLQCLSFRAAQREPKPLSRRQRRKMRRALRSHGVG